MRIVLLAIGIGLAALSSPGPASAQLMALPAPGTLVRVAAPRVLQSWLVGSLESATGESLRVVPIGKDQSVGVSFPSVLRLEKSLSKGTYAGKGRLIGFLVGAALLGATVGATGAHNDPDYGAGIAITASILGGGLAGMATGWAIGGSRDASRWEPIPIAMSPDALPVGSLVRAHTEKGDFVKGTLAAPIGDALTVVQATGPTASMPLASLKRFEVRIGTKVRSRAPLAAGFVLGLVTGGVVGALEAHADKKPTNLNPDYVSKGATGAAVGAAGGWFIGMLTSLHRGEEWVEIPIEDLHGR